MCIRLRKDESRATPDTNILFSQASTIRQAESLRQAAEPEQQQLENPLTSWQECWIQAKFNIAFCKQQRLPCLLVICMFISIPVSVVLGVLMIVK